MKRSNTTSNVRSFRFRNAFAPVALIVLVATVVAVVLVSASNKSNNYPGQTAQHPYTVKPRSGHSDYLVGLTRRAIREGFGKDSVLLLEFGRGPGRDVVAKQIMDLASRRNSPFGERLTATNLKLGRADEKSSGFVGPLSTLKVSADGTRFSMRGNIDDPKAIEKARAGGRRIEKDELEKIGQRFIDEALRDFVKVGPEEKVVFLGAKYLRDEAMSADKKSQSDEVIASIAVFGREVRGVPVIGRGSKVAVWFSNDRRPVAVDVDWPVYRVTRTRQNVLSRDQLFRRVQVTAVSPQNPERGAVARFECGYVDFGATKRQANIQAGCSIHYEGRSDNTPFARVEYVPAGEQVYPDPKWPVARLIAEGKSINTDSKEYVDYVSVKKAAGTAPRRTVPRRRVEP